jgi:predicted phosphoribosyltransferase
VSWYPPQPLFRDRADAGARLAEALIRQPEPLPEGCLVLGLPRGGVIVAAEVARRLSLPLAAWVARKVGAPYNPELALGAAAPGLVLLDHALVKRLGIPQEQVERAVAEATAEVARRQAAWGEPQQLEGRPAILIDDGVATGATMAAGLRALRRRGTNPLWMAAPVGPPDALARLAPEADRCLILEQPADFLAVGSFYALWPEVTDEEVSAALAEARARG